MVARWLRAQARRTFLADLTTFDASIEEETRRLKKLRRAMLAQYEELELSIRAVDLLTAKAEQARACIKQRLAQPEAPVPAVFSRELRQRTEGNTHG